MTKIKEPKLYISNPRYVNDNAFKMSVFSSATGRLGQILISINFIALNDGAIETPPEIIDKLKELLATPGKMKTLKLQGGNQ